MDAKHGPPQHEPGDEDHEQRDDRKPRDRDEARNERQRAVADEGVGDRGIEDRGVGPDEARQAANGGERAERDDEGRQPQQRDQCAVDEAKDQPGEHRGGKPKLAETRHFRDDQAGHGRGGQDRSDREIDASGEDDEGHAGREHGVHRRLLQHDAEILSREEAPVRQEVKADAQQHQHRQHADGADEDLGPLTLSPPRSIADGSNAGLDARGERVLGRALRRHRAAPFRSRAS